MGYFDLSKYSLQDQLEDMLDSDVYADDDIIIKYRYRDSKVDIYTRENNEKGHNSYSGYFHDDRLELHPHRTNSDYNKW